MAKQITEHKVRNLAGKSERYRITENNLQVEVNPSGRRVWFAQGRAQGKRFRKKLGDYPAMSVKDAREAVRKILTERDEGTRIIDDPSSFEAFVEDQFKDWCIGSRKQGEQTMKRLRNTHVPVFGSKKLRDITQQDIERHKMRLLNGTAVSLSKKRPKAKANATVKRDLGDLRRVFSKAVEWGMLRKSPATAVSDPRVEHSEKLYLTEEETKRLHDAVAEWERLANAEWRSKFLPEGKREGHYTHNPDIPKLVRLLVNTGLRKSEALSLVWGDLTDGETPTITVRADVAKSGRRRVIPINKKLAESLIPNTGLPDSHRRVFMLHDPSKAWRKLRAMADLNHITLHHLRHNFASQLVLKGVAPTVIMKLMGHTSLETTMLYFSVRREDEIEAVNLL